MQRHRPRKKFFSRLNINDVGGKTDGFAISIFHQDPRNTGGGRGRGATAAAEQGAEREGGKRAALERAGTGVV